MNIRAILTGLVLLAGCTQPPPAPLLPQEGEPPVNQVTSGRSGEDRDPEISPDGKTLFYASSAFGDHLDLYMKDIGSSTSIRLTTLPGDKRFPRVNRRLPQYLAFSTNARGAWEVAILDLRGDPSRIQFVSEPEVQSIHPSWSPDGRLLVYCSSGGAANAEWTLRIYDFTSGKTYSFEDVDGLLPDWSPIGNRIVFQRMKHRDEWFSSLWTLDFEEGAARHLTVLFSSDDWAAINPSWSPDGTHVVFATVGKSRARAGVLNEGDDIWMVRADGSHPCQLTNRPSADWQPTWGNDGLIYFVSDRSGTNRIWSLKAPVETLGADGPRSTRVTVSGH